MSPNKQTVEKYMAAFRVLDRAEILSCLTDDVEWSVPKAFHVFGKEAFDGQIENDAFSGRPVITTTRLTEENDVVIAEGTVEAQRKDGPLLQLAMCDVFVMKDGLIKSLTSYLVQLH